MHTRDVNGVKAHRHSLCFLLLFIVLICHVDHLSVRSYPSYDDNIRGTLPIGFLPVVLVIVSAWIPTTNRHFYKSSSTRPTISQSFQLVPLTILQNNKKKKTTNEYTDEATNNNINVKKDIGSTTTTANSQSQTKHEQERYEQNLILELQRCITVEDVLHRVGSLLSSNTTTCTNDVTAITANTTISSIQICSLVLIRLSKLYIQMNNQQIYYAQQQQQQQQQSDSAERIPITTHQATIKISSLSI